MWLRNFFAKSVLSADVGSSLSQNKLDFDVGEKDKDKDVEAIWERIQGMRKTASSNLGDKIESTLVFDNLLLNEFLYRNEQKNVLPSDVTGSFDINANKEYNNDYK